MRERKNFVFIGRDYTDAGYRMQDTDAVQDARYKIQEAK
jgi:hypothetical protein